MPNIKSAKKRVKVTASNHEENVHVKGAMKTAYKNAIKEPTLENVKIANKRIDKAVNKGIIKANHAARKKSNIAKKLNETK